MKEGGPIIHCRRQMRIDPWFGVDDPVEGGGHAVVGADVGAPAEEEDGRSGGDAHGAPGAALLIQ